MRRRAFYTLIADPDLPATEDAILQLESAFGRPLHAQPAATFPQVRALMATDLSAQVPVPGIPVLVASARHDRLARPDEGERLAAAWGVPLTLLEGGHAVVVQDAATVNATLRSFWSA